MVYRPVCMCVCVYIIYIQIYLNIQSIYLDKLMIDTQIGYQITTEPTYQILSTP